MDGTIYIENDLIEGSLEFLKRLDEIKAKYVFITNNSSKSVYDYINKLNNMGIKADYDNFFTSAQSTALYINRNYQGKKVYCMGTKSLKLELEKAGINIVENPEKDIDIVLLGYDTELSYKKIMDVCNIMEENTIYLATNPDLLCPAKKCDLPDCGAMSNMLQYSLGRLPYFIGKPNTHMIDDVLKKFNIAKHEAVIVGDRLYTDIKSGKNAEVDTVCVLSGEAKLEDIGDIKPNYVFKSLKEIYKCI